MQNTDVANNQGVITMAKKTTKRATPKKSSTKKATVAKTAKDQKATDDTTIPKKAAAAETKAVPPGKPETPEEKPIEEPVAKEEIKGAPDEVPEEVESHKEGFTVPETTPHGAEGKVTAGFETKTFFGGLLDRIKGFFITTPPEEEEKGVTKGAPAVGAEPGEPGAQPPKPPTPQPPSEEPPDEKPPGEPPAAPTISINDITIYEDTGAGPNSLSFAITLSAVSSDDVTVKWELAPAGDVDVTAIFGTDYTGTTSGTVTIPAGMLSVEVGPFVAVDDNIFEPNETFKIVLSDPTNATISDGIGIGTIISDDPAPTISIDDITIYEDSEAGPNSLSFIVTLSNPTYEDVEVEWNLADVTAILGTDYNGPTSGTVTIAAGDTGSTVGPFTAIDDNIYDPNETFEVTLSNPMGGDATIADPLGVGTIIDDDEAPGLLGEILINEIGLERGTSVEKVRGNFQFVNEDQNFIEIFSLQQQGTISVNQLKSLRVQIIDQDGNLIDNGDGFTIDLSQAAGLSAVPAKSFLVIYEDGTWAISKPGGSGELADIKDAGTFEDANGNAITFDWNLGPDTSYMVAANLVQVEEDAQGNITNQGSLDMFVANDADQNLLIGGSTGWEGPDFNGEVQEGEQYVFARVFGPELEGEGITGDTFDPDTNQALDWTTSNAPTERAYNDSSAYNYSDYEDADAYGTGDYPYSDDTNPLDPTDNFDPNQGAGTNEEDAGQTFLFGTAAADTLEGGAGPDIITGEEGEDTISGEEHDDYLVGGEGADEISGGTGADIIVDTSAERADTIHGGEGFDTFRFTEGTDTNSLALTSVGATTPSDPLTISHIELLDMDDSNGDTLTLDRDRVIALGDDNDIDTVPVVPGSDTGGYANQIDIYVNGDSNDTVNLETTGWTDSGSTIDVGADTYNVYVNTDGATEAIVAIHQQVNVETPDG